MENIMICIGLFGTCGGSTWRNEFIKKYQALNIEFFNPQVDDWKPELAEIEAEHLVNDEIILFPVTSETYGTGSLAETGFSIMQAINSNANRSVVLMIDNFVKDDLIAANPLTTKESLRARALVRAHLKKNIHNNVYIVESLDEMYEVSIKLHRVHTELKEIRDFLNKTK
jgi:hypothetical protein